MNLTSNNNDTYINDTIGPNLTNYATLNQAIINMKPVIKKYNYCKPIPQGKKLTSPYSLNNKQNNRMENERHQPNNNNTEKNKILHFVKSKTLFPGTTNTIYSNEKYYRERTKCNTVPSLDKLFFSPLQKKYAIIINHTYFRINNNYGKN